MMEKISLITLTYNNFSELIKTLNSLENIQGIESIIVNGGSCQKTRDYLTSREDCLSISEPDKGISDAFNKGVKLANYDHIGFLNSGDVLLDKNYYLTVLESFKKSNEVDLVYSNIQLEHNLLGNIIVKPEKSIWKAPYPHPSLIVKKSLFNEIGLFDTQLKIAMDFDFMCRMIKYNAKGIYINKSPVISMSGDGVSSNQGLLGIKEQSMILKKYGLMSTQARLYFLNIKMKTYIRKVMDKLKILSVYDKYTKQQPNK